MFFMRIIKLTYALENYNDLKIIDIALITKLEKKS